MDRLSVSYASCDEKLVSDRVTAASLPTSERRVGLVVLVGRVMCDISVGTAASETVAGLDTSSRPWSAILEANRWLRADIPIRKASRCK